MGNKATTERINIKEIKNPNEVKSLTGESLKLLCKDIREEIVRVTSTYGGHLSSNLGDVELTVALCRQFDFSQDKLIFDVGHQSYTYKILTGRSLENLNHKNCVSGFQKMDESPYDCYEAGHSSTSLSAAEAFALKRDLNKEKYNVIAFIGDSSIVNGLSFEALNHIGHTQTKVIIILNDNDMSITKPIGGLGKFFRNISTGKVYNKMKRGYKNIFFRGAFGRKINKLNTWIKNRLKYGLVPTTMFDNMGFTYIGPIDGHNIKEIEKAIARAKVTSKPAIIHALTTKGKGFSLAEGDKTGYWHGVTPFDVKTGKPLKEHPGSISWSHYFSDLTEEFMREDESRILISPATLKGSGLEKCFELYPQRCFDVGIAEEHALTMAGAFSLNGLHPIVSIYSTFLQRAYDEISHDCCRMKTNMTILIDRAGLVGTNGETHQGIYDEAFLKSIPGTILAMPSNKSIARTLFAQSLSNKGVFGIRFPREMVLVDEKDPLLDLPFGRMRFVKESKNKKLVVISVGPKVETLLKQIEELDLDVTLIDPVYLNPVDEKDVEKLLSYENIIIHDAYGTKEGFTETLLSLLSLKGFKGSVYPLALPNCFIRQASTKEQEVDNKVDVDTVLAKIKEIL